MELNDRLIIKLAVLAATTVLVALGKLDPSVFIAIVGVILGEQIYTVLRKRA